MIAIFMGSLLGFMVVTTFDFISENNLGLFNWISIPWGIKNTCWAFINRLFRLLVPSI